MIGLLCRRLGSVTAGLSVERIQICAVLDGLGSVAVIVHQLAVDDDFITCLDLGIAFLELLVAEIQGAVYVEFVGFLAVIGNIECTVAVLCSVRLLDGRYLALDIEGSELLVIVVGGPAEAADGLEGGGHVERIFLGAGALGIAGRGRSAAGHAVQRIQVGVALGSLIDRGSGTVEHDVAIDNDIVADLDLGVLGRVILVAKVFGAVHLELGGAGGAVIGDVEGTVAVLGGILLADGRDLALDIHLLGAVRGRIVQAVDVSDHALDGERALKGALAVVDLAFLALLGDLDILLHQADGEGEVDLAVEAVIGDDGDGDTLGVQRRTAGGGIHGHPVGSA